MVYYKGVRLGEFNNALKNLLGENDGSEFTRVALSGHYAPRDIQFVVDPILDAMRPEEVIKVLRDLDSGLWIDAQLQMVGPATIYPVSKKEDTLTTNIHIRHEFTNSQVCLTPVFLLLY